MIALRHIKLNSVVDFVILVGVAAYVCSPFDR